MKRWTATADIFHLSYPTYLWWHF